MRIVRRSVAAGVALVVALVVALLLAATAVAHALPQSSDPSPGSSLATAPTVVTITFGETPDPKLSTIRVLDTAGTLVSTGPTTADAADARTLTVALSPIGQGLYTVAWRTVSAVDGHLASGSFAFGVGVSPSAPPSGKPGGPGSATSAGPPQGAVASGPSAAAVAARWLLFVGLLALLGGASFGILIAPPSVVLVRRWLPFAWLIAAAGTAAVIAVELGESGVSLADAFGTSFGTGIVERTVPVVVAGAGVALAATRSPARGAPRWALPLVALGAGAGLLADVLLSHAAAGGDAASAIVIQAIHVIAVGLWLGGLAGLLLTIGRTADERTARTARQFSWLATIGIATVAVTGLLRAIAEVGSIDALVTTDFGRLVIAKAALLGGLALLGAVNHFRNVPAAGRSVRGLRRIGSLELLIAATVLLLSATLVNLAPPSEVAAARGGPEPSVAAAPSPSPLVVEGSDYGTSVRVALAVSPGSAGFNDFTATVTDYDTGAAVDAVAVSLRFVFPTRPDVGSSRLDLARTGAGVFSATGSNLSLDGTWQVTATVTHGTSAVQVPLEVTTRPAGGGAPSPTPQVDVNAVPGLPTIYTVHLSAGRTLQVYLDPGTGGANEVHATFFDATGIELPVASVTMSMGPSGGDLAPLIPRELEPGHFVADTTVSPGTYTLNVAGPAPDGGTLSTSIDIPVTK